MTTTPRRLIGLSLGDEAAAWRDAGFDVEEGRLHVGGVVLTLDGVDGPRGVRGWVLDPPAAGACDGLAPAPAAGGLAAGERAHRHPNGVVALDHVVVTSDDVERTTDALAELGLTPRRTVVGARGDGDEDVVYRFFLLGTSVLELVGPSAPTGDGPARFAGLAFTTERIDELGDLAGTPRPAVQPGRRIATLRTEPLGISVPTVVLTPRPSRPAPDERPTTTR